MEYCSELVLGEMETELVKCQSVSIMERHRRNFSILMTNYNDIDIIGCNKEHNEIHIFRHRKFSNCLGIVSQPEYVSRPNTPNELFAHILNIDCFEKLMNKYFERN